jgi:hypothetical protein
MAMKQGTIIDATLISAPQASVNGVPLSIMVKAAIVHLMPYVSGDKALKPGNPAMQDLQDALATLGRLQISQSSRMTKFWKPLFMFRRKIIEIIRQCITGLSSL